MSGETCPFAYSLFQQPWWLEAVAPGSWDCVECVQNDEVVGRLPFVKKRRYGLTILSQATLTPFLGPWTKSDLGKHHNEVGRQHEIFDNLIDQLPPHDIFLQKFHYPTSNCLAFAWRGFSEKTGYTYAIEDLSDLDRVWKDFRDVARSAVRRAKKKVSVRPTDDIDTFIELNQMMFEAKGMPPHYSADLWRRIDKACAARGKRQILLAEDADGAKHAALYTVWDDNCAYYLASGSNPELRKSGALSLLMWESIKHASNVSRRYDFEGSMIKPIERFIRNFGGRQRQYPIIIRGATWPGRMALIASDLRRVSAA